MSEEILATERRREAAREPDVLRDVFEGSYRRLVVQLYAVTGDSVMVGVLAVPASAAQEVADDLVAAGVKIIFNYSEQLLQVPPEVTVHTSSPAVDLLYALYFYLT